MSDALSNATAFANSGAVWTPSFKVFIGTQGIAAPTAIPNTEIPTAISAQVQKSNWYQADRHKVVFSLFGNPDFGYGFWTSFNSASIMVQISFDGATYTEVFRGFVDKVIMDCMKGTVTCIGRNVLGLLIDFRQIQTNINGTPVEILNQIFEAVNLPDPDTAQLPNADKPYGRIFNEEQSTTSQGENSLLNPMDVIMAICQQVGGRFYEEQGQVHFVPEITPDNTVKYLALAPIPDYGDQPGVTKLGPSNATSLIVEHDLNIAQWDWFMQVNNYDENGKAEGNQVVFPEGNQGSALNKPYPLWHANKTPDDAKLYAQSMYTEFTLHEWVVTYKVAGDQIIGMSLNDKIGVQGIGDPVDGWFLIDSIEHNISFQKGYSGTVRGRWGRTT